MAALRKTKIVCTLGPATEDDAVLREMILSGLNVARLNFSHGSYEGHGRNIRRVRTLSQELHTPIGIMLDTKGPGASVCCPFFMGGSSGADRQFAGAGPVCHGR